MDRRKGGGVLQLALYSLGATSTTDKAGRISVMLGLTLLIVLRLTSIGGMDPPGMTVNFFGIIPPSLGAARVVPVNFAQKSLRIKLDSCEQCTTIVQRSTEEWLARKGLIFTKEKC